MPPVGLPVHPHMTPSKVLSAALPCPCGNKLAYADCCGAFHAGEAAPTPEKLMRSRYAAYVLQLAPYLLQTWAEATQPATLDFAEDGAVKWLGLEIKHAQAQGDDGLVEFVARYKSGGRATRMHETSRFKREPDGRWYYVDGDMHEK